MAILFVVWDCFLPAGGKDGDGDGELRESRDRVELAIVNDGLVCCLTSAGGEVLKTHPIAWRICYSCCRIRLVDMLELGLLLVFLLGFCVVRREQGCE